MSEDVGRSVPDGLSSAAPIEPVPVSPVPASIPSAPAAWQVGKCRVPMWSMGCPAGFCDDVAYGHQLPSDILRYERSYDREYNRVPYCFGHCCPGHGGPGKDDPRFFTDGITSSGYQMWCCVGPDFENLQESPAGFDGNPFVAREKYRAASAIDARSDATGTGAAEGKSAVGDSRDAQPPAKEQS